MKAVKFTLAFKAELLLSHFRLIFQLERTYFCLSIIKGRKSIDLNNDFHSTHFKKNTFLSSIL